MSKLVVSISGKGGCGKTTLTALLLKAILKNKPNLSILVVDADPATNLPEVLGVEVNKTVGDVANELKRRVEKGGLPTEISKSELLEAWIYETLIEGEDFDFLAMGRTEGEGCYCYVNSVLSRILDTITENYDVTLMDMEAGLEHISRRTDRDVDVMIILTDASRMGFKTAERIKALTEEVHVNVKRRFLVGNQFPSELEQELKAFAEMIGVEYGGVIPYDSNVSQYNVLGKPLIDLPDDSPALRAAEGIARRVGLI